MKKGENIENLRHRAAPLEMTPHEFRALGYETVDRIAGFLASLPQRPVGPGESVEEVRKLLVSGPLPEHGTHAADLLKETSDLLFDHSVFNGHPRFLAYITSSAAPIGALGDLLAAAVNPNVGSFSLSPIATEIEAQTVRWIAEMIGYPSNCGGLLVSGGNMANFVGFLAARRAKASWDIRTSGIAGGGRTLRLYTSRETHTWIQKAADLFGLGTDSIRWIPTDAQLRMDPTLLQKQIREDKDKGDLPFLVIGTAGSVSTGALDPLPALSTICREHGLWFHVDGAYGALAAVLPDASEDLKGLRDADSVAVDPHKWLYTPLEAGCALVRKQQDLLDAFSYHPPYYHFDADGTELPINYYEMGMQNSRGFRALKVWLALRQVGREGYVRMIADDIALARELYRSIGAFPELQAFTHGLSITTFRYVPKDLKPGEERIETYLNTLNAELLTRLQESGRVYLSNAVINGVFLLRACVVNMRTSLTDIEALPHIVVDIGGETDRAIRPAQLKTTG